MVEFGGKVDDWSSKSGSAEDLINNDLFADLSLNKFLKNRISQKELYFYNHPKKKEFEKIKSKSIYLGYFDKWDGKKHFEIAKKRIEQNQYKLF